MPPLILFKGDETWELREVPKPTLRPGCAVLRVEAVGICHSDVDQFRGHAPVPSGGVFPTVPGHEIVGRIEEITPEAEFGVRVGDRVGVRSVVRGPAGSRVYGFDFPSTRAPDSSAATPTTWNSCPAPRSTSFATTCRQPS